MSIRRCPSTSRYFDGILLECGLEYGHSGFLHRPSQDSSIYWGDNDVNAKEAHVIDPQPVPPAPSSPLPTLSGRQVAALRAARDAVALAEQGMTLLNAVKKILT